MLTFLLASGAKGGFRKAHGSVAPWVDLIAQLVPGIGRGGPEPVADDGVLVVHHIVVAHKSAIVVVVVASKSVVVVIIYKTSVSVVAVKPIVVVEVVLGKAKATDGEQTEAHQENLEQVTMIIN